MFSANVENEVLGSAGVDALTLTSKTTLGRAGLVAVFEELAAESVEGVDVWKGLGYKGYKVGDVIYGSREGGGLLIAKGRSSERVYRTMVDVAPIEDVKVTRVDVCVDFAFDTPWVTYLREMHSNEGLQHMARRARREFKLVSSMTGDTLYFGKRTSPRFGRIYDKSVAYNLERGTVYRYEVESKKAIATVLADKIFLPKTEIKGDETVSRETIKKLVRYQFLKWGVNLEWNNVDTEVIRAEVRVSEPDRQIEWLSRSVAPTVEKLRHMGYEQRVFDALGITPAGDLTERD